MYDELIRVPLFIKPPNSLNQNRRFPRGITIKAEVSTLDILPTILDCTGVSSGSFEKNIKGQSLIPLMLGEMNGTENRVLYGVGNSGMYGKMYYAIHDGWKLIWYQQSDKLELYNLRIDPIERKNLFSPQHPIGRNLLASLEEFAQNFKNTRKDKEAPPDLPLRLKKELEALGYVE